MKISDEKLETLRLRYIEKFTQDEAAEKMKISQSQYQRDLIRVRKEITNIFNSNLFKQHISDGSEK